MKTFTTLFAATALLASASTATLAQVSAGGALDAGSSISVDAGGTSVDAGATGSANANASSNAGGNGNASGNAGGSANSNAGGNGNSNASANASGSAEGQLNYGSIISDLRSSSVTTADIEAIDDDAQINIVTLSELRGNAAENANALDEAVSAQGTTLAELQAAIEGNTDLSTTIEAALQAEGDFDMEDVVAITSSANGELTLVVDDSE